MGICIQSCAGPTMGHLQHFFIKKDKCPGRGGGGMGRGREMRVVGIE